MRLLEHVNLTVAQSICAWRHLAPRQKIQDLQEDDLDEAMKYKSDTDFMGPNGSHLPQ